MVVVGGGVHCGHVDTERALVVMVVVADLLCVCSLVAVFFLPSTAIHWND